MPRISWVNDPADGVTRRAYDLNVANSEVFGRGELLSLNLTLILDELTRHKVGLVCTSQGIDTTENNPAGRLQLGVLMAVAKFERELIRERTLSGLAAAKARGKRLGRPPSLRKHAAPVQKLRKAGKSIRAIAGEPGLPVSSVHSLCPKVTPR